MGKKNTNKDPKTRRSVLDPPSTLAKSAPQKGVEGHTKDPPIKGKEWLNILAPHLFFNSPKFRERSLMMCEETATALLNEEEEVGFGADEEEPLFSARENEARDEAIENMVSPTSRTEAKKFGASSQRIVASYVLVAGSVAARQDLSFIMAQRGIDLALRAAQIYRSPLTTTTVAFACYWKGALLQERNCKEELFSLAANAADTIAKELVAAPSATAEDISCLARLCWLLAFLGHVEVTRAHVSDLLRMDNSNYLGLLLLALLHTVDSSFDKASTVLATLHQTYPNDLPCAMLSTVVKLSCEQKRSASSNSFVLTELATVLARLRELTSEVAHVHDSKDRKSSIKALTVHCTPGEDREEGLSVSIQERKRFVAGHWALLSHIAVRAGATSISEVATEAGISYIVKQRDPHPQALADLLCCSARRTLIAMKDRMPMAYNIRELNLLDNVVQTMPDYVEHDTPVSKFSLAATVRGSATQKLLETPNKDAKSKMEAEHTLVRTQLLKALEACPGHSESYTLYGVQYLLQAGQPLLSAAERQQLLAQAAHVFTSAIRCELLNTEAHQGLGVVREAEGALEVSADFYASASNLEMKEPLIDFKRFAYLFM